MREWKEHILEDIIDKFIDYRGKTPKKSDRGIPLVTAKIVKNGKILTPNEFIVEEDYSSWMTRGLPEINDIVLTTEAPLGEVALIKDKNIALAQRIITLRGVKEIVCNRFLKYYFQSREGQYLLQSRASGTTVFGIKASVLKKIPINLPPLPEQKAIAEVLSSLDDKIDLLHCQNKALEQMAETLFRQWFVEEAKEEWEDGVLGDIARNVKDGIKVIDIKQNMKYVALEHIRKKEIALLDYELAESVGSNKYKFKKGDILFGKLRPYFHKVCFTRFAGICSTDILVIRSLNANLFCFCLFAFYQKEVVDFANSGTTGTRMPRTNWKILSSYKIKIPDNKNLSRFNEFVIPAIGKIEKNIRQIRTLENLRDTLLPKLMSGVVSVKN